MVIQLIGMAPYVKDLRRFRRQFHKALPHLHKPVKFHGVIYIGIEAEQIFLRLEAVCIGDGAAVFDTGIFPDDLRYSVSVIHAAAGIGHAYNLIVNKFLQIYPIRFHLADDFCFVKPR